MNFSSKRKYRKLQYMPTFEATSQQDKMKCNVLV